MNVYQISCRSLLPAKLDGVIVAGRSLSATHGAQEPPALYPPTFATGEAAGAAALAVQNDVRPRDVAIPALREVLPGQGVYLGERRDSAASNTGAGQ